MQYEGEELSQNVFYTGAAPNQQAIPAVEDLMSRAGGGAKRFFLFGTDYIYPRTTNKILRALLNAKAWPRGTSRRSTRRSVTATTRPSSRTSSLRRGGKTAVISTINGDCNVPFYTELANEGHRRPTSPSWPFWSARRSCGIDTKPLAGHLAAWNYFMSLKDPANTEFIKKWQAYGRNKSSRAGTRRDQRPDGSHLRGHPHVGAGREKGGDHQGREVRKGMAGSDIPAPSGYTLKMDESNHHLWKPVMIGEVQGNGPFDVVWKTDGPVRAQP